MKSRELLIAGILSVQAVCGLSEKQQPQLRVNPILEAKPKEIGARNGQEGLRNLIDSGLLQPVDGSKRNKARHLNTVESPPTAPEVETMTTGTTPPHTEAQTTANMAQAPEVETMTTGTTPPNTEVQTTAKMAEAPEVETMTTGTAPPNTEVQETAKMAQDQEETVRHGYYYSEDYSATDAPSDGVNVYIGDGLYLVNAFQDSRESADPIVPDFTDPDEFAAGTVYLFKDAPLQNKTAIDASGLLGLAQGTCTRTQDPQAPGSTGMDGKSYCQFTYEFIDEDGSTYASFTAEGAGQGNFTSLTVTGGLGELDGVSGTVDLYVAMLDFSTMPPMLIQDGDANDLLAFVTGYDMYAYLYIPSHGTD